VVSRYDYTITCHYTCGVIADGYVTIRYARQIRHGHTLITITTEIRYVIGGGIIRYARKKMLPLLLLRDVVTHRAYDTRGYATYYATIHDAERRALRYMADDTLLRCRYAFNVISPEECQHASHVTSPRHRVTGICIITDNAHARGVYVRTRPLL